MILITGSILAREDWFGDVGRSCLERVERSRKEPGSSRMMCMSTAGTRCGGRFEGVRKIPRGPDRRNLGRQDIYRAKAIPRWKDAGDQCGRGSSGGS